MRKNFFTHWLRKAAGSASLLVAMAALTACPGDSDDIDDEAAIDTDFVEWGTGSSSLVSDVVPDDIDWLIDYAASCELLELEYIRYCSNDFKSGLMTGPGEYSDETEFYETIHHILANQAEYQTAFKRLDQRGILTGVTTRGLWDAAFDFMNDGLAGSAKRRQQTLVNTLREMGAFSNKQMQDDIFNCIPEGNREGYTDSHSFFVALNNGGMANAAARQLTAIRDAATTQEEGHVSTWAAWEDAEEKLGYSNHKQQVVDEANLLKNKAVKLEKEVLDKLSGGAVSRMEKVNNVIEDAKKVKDAIFGGKTKITREDVEKALKQYSVTQLKNLMPKTGVKYTDDALKLISNTLGNTALKEDPDGENAKKEGKTIMEIENNTGQKTKANIVVDEKTGKTIVALPDEKGKSTVVTEPGDKKITGVTENGQRTTKQTTASKQGGKQKEPLEPESTEKPQLTTQPDALTFEADAKEGQTFTVTTNCKYVAAKSSAKWLTVKVNKQTGVVSVTATANTESDARKATIRVAGSNDNKNTAISTTVSVTQKKPAGGDLSFGQTKLVFGKEATSKEYAVGTTGFSNYGATVDSDSKSWLSVKTGSGNAKSLTISVTENKLPLSRIGEITLWASNGKQSDKDAKTITITVEQERGTMPELDVQQSVPTFDAKGGSSTMTVKTNLEKISATSSADWLTVSVTKTQLTLRAAKNTGNERTAKVKVSASTEIKNSSTGQSVEFSVTQLAGEAPDMPYGNEILWGTWTSTNEGSKLVLGSSGSYHFTSGSVSESGSFKCENFKSQPIAGTNGYSLSGTLIDPKKQRWTITTYYSKDGSGHYKKRKYCLWLTNQSTNSTRVLYKVE